MFQRKTTIIPVKYSCKGLRWCGLRQLRSMSVKAYQISEQCLMLHCVECRILGERILQLQYSRWVYMHLHICCYIFKDNHALLMILWNLFKYQPIVKYPLHGDFEKTSKRGFNTVNWYTVQINQPTVLKPAFKIKCCFFIIFIINNELYYTQRYWFDSSKEQRGR